MLRYLTAGESHGKGLVVIVEGLPAGLPITVEEVQAEMARRRLGFGRGPRQRFEDDNLTLLGGVRHGRTLGSPVAIEIENTEWFRSDKWHEEMSPAPGQTREPLTQVRPGHADLAGMQKYGFTDARDVLERASARETAARVAAGCLAKKLLGALGVEILSHVIQLGPVRAKPGHRPLPGDRDVVDESPVRCFDRDTEARMIEEIEAAAKDGDSLGGVVEVLAYGVPVGLGSHVHWDRKLDGLIAQAILSIQAVKGVEIGDGFDVAGRRGSAAHDPIVWDAEAGQYRRESSLSGGTEGGMSTGEVIAVRAAMKPLATLNRPVLKTVDVVTKEETVSFKERTDVTAVPAMGIVAETMVALVLASEAQRKFGGDSLGEFVRNAEAYRAGLAPRAVNRSDQHVVLVGMMGAGKTTVGRLVADRLGRRFLDSDSMIEARTGRTVREIFAADGEEAFRTLESAVLAEALATPEPAVIAAADGVVLRDENRRALKSARARVVWLCATPALLTERVTAGGHRPLLDDDPAGVLARMSTQRDALYREVSDAIVGVDGRSVQHVVKAVLR